MPDPVGQQVHARLCDSAAATMRNEIRVAGGSEVFFAGSLNGAGLVEKVRVCARGNAGAVPAFMETLMTGEVVLHNHPSGNIVPSDADLNVASLFSHNGHGVYIINNDVSRVYVVVEPFLPKDRHLLTGTELIAALAPGSRMAKSLPDFEVRPQQATMMEAVARAFNEEGIAVVEAPTGVGKTVAYLLPAILWAVRNRERVVVSTKTINLQEQIIFKDIPLLAKCLDAKFCAVLVKGRNNYVCRRKFERTLSEATLYDDEVTQEMLKTLAQWITKTEDGSLSDLSFVPPYDLWDRLCSEADTCPGGRCPSAGKCFVTRARREMAKADLLVVNHHMLFSDLAVKREIGSFNAPGVLPTYTRVIFDEAHNVEESATEYFGVEATRNGSVALLNLFVRQERGRERGLLPYIKVKLMKEVSTASVQDITRMLEFIDNTLLPSLAASREAIITAFAALRSYVAEHCEQIGRDVKWRLTPEVLAHPELREIHRVYMVPAAEELLACAKHCTALYKDLSAVQPAPDQPESPFVVELAQLNAYQRRLQRLANVLSEATSEKLQPNTVRWVELDASKPTVIRVARCPLEVGGPLAEWVYANLKTVVMTSATLSVRRSFDYLAQRIGLDQVTGRNMDYVLLDSPFDFAQQAILGIPRDTVDPDDKRFLDQTVEMVRETLSITRGHAFVLFTSFYALDYVFRRLEDELRKSAITPLKQGGATRTQLLERFRSDTASVLFATDSFWEGVDVAGEALQCVILPKLPFKVPTEPVLQARAEAIDAAGGNSFMAYVVPQAVIKFRQGFGRLIRRKTDRGGIIVLDRRILTKYYGRAFLESLPEVKVVAGPQRGVFMALRDFFAKGEST